MQLYDTLTGTKRPLEPRDPGRVGLYVCGPTVYDAPHLGHARSALTYDILRRFLEWRGFDVYHVANVTDIDDNIINRANDEGSTEPEIAETWKAIYDKAIFDDLGML
ncbi:MAG: class I tRNA ligase family protein, partial [Acidimicrobiales bacterium]